MTDKHSQKALLHPELTVDTILSWADKHYIRVGQLPSSHSGAIPESDGITWHAVDASLRRGRRGLPPNGSLAVLLQQHRNKPNMHNRPDLTIERILSLADSYYFLHGTYPKQTTGVIGARVAEKWSGIDRALRLGTRGLPGGSSLSQLLEEHRGVRNKKALPRYTPERILEWADAYYARNRRYPTRNSGKIKESPGDTWPGVQSALVAGLRGLPGGSSLAQLLASERGVRNVHGLPRLTRDQILAWADAHYARHGTYPTLTAGPVDDIPGETWFQINASLRLGLRGLSGGGSLLQLLVEAGKRQPRGRKPGNKASSRKRSKAG
ncbi:MAG: hypothetical protein ACLQVD_03935 [Capsulimonadaceae bacterium]